MTRTIRILHLITGLKKAGAEVNLQRLLEVSRPPEFESKVISLSGTGPQHEAISRLADTHTVNLKTAGGWARLLCVLLALRIRWRPDVIHSHLIHANLLSRAVRCLWPRALLINTVHSIESTHPRLLPLLRLSDGLVDHVVHVGSAGKRLYEAKRLSNTSKMAVIPNFVDCAVFHPDEKLRDETRRSLRVSPEFVWLAVGRLHPVKDYSTLLAALRRVLRERPGTTLIIVGDGELRSLLQEEAVSKGVNQKVVWIREAESTHALYCAADSFVHAARQEAFGMAIAEAMACQLPIVSTCNGGAEELIVNSENGRLVPVGSPAALSQAMIEMAAVPGTERRRMGEAGRRKVVQCLDSRRIAEHWHDLYRTSVKARIAYS